jgi:flagellar biosynthetic protein FlhB
MASDQSSRTEKPTPRRLEKARREGQFTTSREFVSAVQFLTFLTLLSLGIAAWTKDFQLLTHQLLSYPFRTTIDSAHLMPVLRGLFVRTFLPLITGGAVIVLAVLAVHLTITKLGFSWKKLNPDLKRLSPLTKLKQLPRQNFVLLVQALLILFFLGGSVTLLVWNNAALYASLPLAGVRAGIAVVGDSIDSLLWKAAVIFLILGCVDFFRQHRRFMAELRMSRQEIQDEMKETEGNPLIKVRVRRLQRDLRRRRMMSQVPNATVVVVNPTHFAVALKYEPQLMPAPVVLAKGKNYLALRIKERAIQHGVPIVENPPVAQALYKSADIGQEIPPHLYRAVAEILAYIHRLMQVRR